MGNRVHVVKKQREYGGTEAFNWAFEEFKDLLRDLGCNVCEQDEYSPDFEMSCEEYERGIEILKRIKDALDQDENFDLNCLNFSDLTSDDDEPDWCSFDPDNYDWNDVKDDLKKLNDYSIGEILKIMQDFWEERDKNSSWIQFCSF